MRNLARYTAQHLAAYAFAVFFSIFALTANANAGKVPGPLVNVDWLAANKGNVVILDVSKKEKGFLKHGHIPGAVFVPWGEVRAKKKMGDVQLIKMLPSAASFARLMKKSGVNADSAIVITTAGDLSKHVFFGTRLYWQLKYYGHDNIAMLDGGNAAWAKAKKPLSHDKSAARAGNWAATAERKELLATTADVEGMVKAGSKDLVDARTLDYHIGLEQKKKYVYNNGHIPGSKIVPHNLVMAHKGPATFRDAGQIKSTLTAMGVDLNASNVSYCNSGHLGSGLWFVMHELAGNKSAKLYDGSMHAWTKDKTRPVTKMKLN